MPYKDPEKQREYQKKWMYEYRKLKKEREREERKLLLKIQGFPEYKALSKVKQKAVDQAVITLKKQVDQEIESAAKETLMEAQVVLRQQMAQLRAQIVNLILHYGELARKAVSEETEKVVQKWVA